MRNKIRVLGAVLYCVKTDIAYLMQNQKVITRYLLQSRRHFLSEMLQRCGHAVSARQTDTWINEANQANIQDDVNRTFEQKQKRIKRKHNRYLKSFADGRETLDHYKSGGKTTKQDPDLMLNPDEEDEETEKYPATEEVLKTFSIKGLKLIAERLIQKAGGDVRERTQDIPTSGKGQKAKWSTLLWLLIEEQNLQTLDVPITGTHPPSQTSILHRVRVHVYDNTYQLVPQHIDWCRHVMCPSRKSPICIHECAM